jgi:phosphatidate cytidylyltransferase
MQRLLTAAVAVPLFLAALFYLPAVWFFALVAGLVEWGAFEFVRVVRPWAPRAPLRLILLFVPLAAGALALALSGGGPADPGLWLAATAGALSLGLGTLLLVSGTPVQESLGAFGAFAFGVPYFALPIASLYRLKAVDPWLGFLLLAIVWLGDTAALYAGTAFGRHRMAPVVSPNKTWEGAAAGFLTGVGATAVWSFCQLREIDPRLLAVGASTAVAAQVGDLVESMIKRGAGVKDSGGGLPGHGGMLDRIDALLFAAPVLLAGMWLIDFEVAGP